MVYTFKVLMKFIVYFSIAISPCLAQSNVSIPLSPGSFRNIIRTFVPVPRGRVLSIKDVRILYLSNNFMKPKVYNFAGIKGLLADPEFDPNKPTTIYIHGYVEKASDDSIHTIVRSYRRHGGYNLLVLDWSNLAFGNYIGVIYGLQKLGERTGQAVEKLIRGGLSLEGLHVVGHSLGVHLGGYACRYLKNKGFMVPRLTGLDPAYPGFYLPVLVRPVNRDDALFFDVVHTDAGGFGEPLAVGHADFWPNAGRAKQPGCLPLTLPVTIEDFCSHWRSWKFWAESVEGGQFLARKCDDYDAFLRGRCQEEPTVHMGLYATPDLRGNFYLRTAAKSPFALAERGAE
ncbi:unnamed protein product [Parnassius apollo]|uniref:(apollo) hypothetical protein n=1 Tax=Parnassius apollo TaxID=110799 RepID=A0A8S3Y8B2_PARAO|nr:unnamed protein product [Parnassius apollo]